MNDLNRSSVDPGPLGVFDDAVRRIVDAVTEHLTHDPHGAPHRWLAFRLDTGECDKTLYDSRSDVIRIKGMFAKHWGALQILPMGMRPVEAAAYLKFSRQVADNPRLRWKLTADDIPAEIADQALMLQNMEEIRRRLR